MNVVENLYKKLGEMGFLQLQINERLYAYLGELGYTQLTLQERIVAYGGWLKLINYPLDPVGISPYDLFDGNQDGWIHDFTTRTTLWQDEERTTLASLPGDPVWWIDDSKTTGTPINFGVEASANRGRLLRWPASAVREGRVRNLLINSGDLTKSPWEGYRVVAISPTRIRETDSSGSRVFRQTINIVAGNSYVWQVTLKKGLLATAPDWVQLTNGLTTFGAAYANVNVVTGEVRNFNGANVTSTPSLSIPGAFKFTYQTPVAIASGLDNGVSIIFCDNNPDAVRVPSYTGSITSDVQVFDFSLELGSVANPYQEVGAGIWDVTEEGQPECWGILPNGTNTRYISDRGIPSFTADTVNIAAGQTKFIADGTASLLLSNRSTAVGSNIVSLFAPGGSASYNLIQRTTANPTTTASTPLDAYPSPSSNLLDARVAAAVPSAYLQVDNDAPLVSTGSLAGVINNSAWALFAEKRTGATNYYSGIYWGGWLVNEESLPEDRWTAAKQWLSDKNMGGLVDYGV